LAQHLYNVVKTINIETTLFQRLTRLHWANLERT